MNDQVTMDAEEIRLLDRYEAEFKEVPPIAFCDPETSKRLLKEALNSKIPFNERALDTFQDE